MNGPSLSRRTLLKLGIATAGLCATGAAALSSWDTTDLDCVEREILIPDLPRNFDHYRIGFLSDIHLGVCIPETLVIGAVDYLRKSAVDLVLLGGDYVWIPEDSSTRALSLHRNRSFEGVSQDDLPEAVFSSVGKMLSGLEAKDGLLSVMGNHDRWVSPKLCKRMLSDSKVELLSNSLWRISRGEEFLTVIGCEDYWTAIPRLPELPERTSGTEARVLLAHNPDFFSYVLDRTDVELDLCLAGHTHGGQIKLPGVGALKYNIRDLRFCEGLFQHPRGTAVYVTRGVGVVELPFRVNCPPEVTLLTLRRA